MSTQSFLFSQATRRDVGWVLIEEALAARAQTQRGAARARAPVFFATASEAEQSFLRIEAMRRFFALNHSLPVGGTEDIAPLLGRLKRSGALDGRELLACRDVMLASLETHHTLAAHPEKLAIFQVYLDGLPLLRPLVREIESVVEPSGAIRDDASKALFQLREQARQLRKRIRRDVEVLFEAPELSVVWQERYLSVRGDRYVVPVVSSFQAKVPGIIHNSSQTDQTVFVEPEEIVPQGNRLAVLLGEIRQEEERVLIALSADVQVHHLALATALESLAFLDSEQARAQLAEDLELVTPRFTHAGLALPNLRHPHFLLRKSRAVPSTVSLAGSQQALVVSGPNAGGKTVLLTAVGLALVMSRAGLPIAASKSACLPFCAKLICLVGDAQDLSAGLSSFSAHAKALSRALEEAGPASVVLIDEIGGDTNPREGAALAQAVVEALAARGAYILVTTHLEELKTLAFSDPRFVTARVGKRDADGTPTYELEQGKLGHSNALHIAEQAGLGLDILARAQALLTGGSQALSLAVSGLQTAERETEQAAENFRRENLAHAQARATLETERRLLAETRRAVKQSEAKARLEALEEARLTLNKMIRDLQSQPSLRAAESAKRDVEMKRERTRKEVASTEDKRPLAVSERPHTFVVGAKVRSVSLAQEGTVISVMAKHILLRVGGVALKVAKEDVILPLGIVAPRHTPPPPVSFSRQTTCGDPGSDVLDIRGLRVDEAARILEATLDRALAEGHSQITVIHGHGTGALRDWLRETLALSPYAASHRPGQPEEGGDGVTLVLLSSE